VMKRYENRIVAALVQYLFLIVMCSKLRTINGAPYSTTTWRRGNANANRRNNVINSMQCTQTKSYFFRSQCSDNGYLTVHRNRVLVQTTGLSDSHEQAEFMIEMCTNTSATSWMENGSYSPSRPIMRYRHKKSKKYICFSKKGRVRVVNKKHVERRGALCMFRQVPVSSNNPYEDKTYHRLQSVHNRRWHLGFNHKNSSLSYIKDREPHKGALPRIGRHFDSRKCDYKFFAGEYLPVEEMWSGGFDLIRDHKINKFSSKAAINSEMIITNEVGDGKDDTASASEFKISKAHKEALLQQQILNKMRQRKIRHSRHKKPRLSRREKNGLKELRRKQPMSKSYKNN